MTINDCIKKYGRQLFHNDMGVQSKWEYAYMIHTGAITKHKSEHGQYHTYNPVKYKQVRKGTALNRTVPF